MGEASTLVLSKENSVIRWLMTEGLRITDAKTFLESFAARLRSASIDIVTPQAQPVHPRS